MASSAAGQHERFDNFLDAIEYEYTPDDWDRPESITIEDPNADDITTSWISAEVGIVLPWREWR